MEVGIMECNTLSPVRPIRTRVRGGGTIFLIFLFVFAIMLCAPKSYDDFEFSDVAQGSFRDILDFSLRYGNGRFLGNLCGVVIQRSPVLAAGVKALTLTGLICLMPLVLGYRSPAALGGSFLLLVGMEPGLFAQSITWNSGFGNFVPPAVLSILVVYLLQHYPQGPGQAGRKALACLAILLLGAASQLYAEHSTLVNIALALVVLVKVCHDRKRGLLLPAVLFFLATLTGGGLMVLIPKIFARTSSHTDGYRAIHLYSLFDTLFCCARNFLRLSNQYCGLSGLPVCLGAIFTVRRTAPRRSEKANTCLLTLSALSGGYMLLTRLMGSNSWSGDMALLQHALEACVVATPLAIWIIALFSETDKLYRDRQLALLGLALFSLAPLLVVHPIGFRVQFHSYVFVIMACLLSCMPQTAAWSPKMRSASGIALRGACLLLALCMCVMFFSIHTMDRARNNHIRQQMEAGAEEIFIFRFPYPYIHDSRDACLGMYFYYDEPMDITFPVLSFDIWQDQYWDSAK